MFARVIKIKLIAEKRDSTSNENLSMSEVIIEKVITFVLLTNVMEKWDYT